MQSRLTSLVEKICDSVSGVALSWGLTMTVLPAVFGFQTDARTSIEITLIYTGVSVVRGYIWRRIFNSL